MIAHFSSPVQPSPLSRAVPTLPTRCPYCGDTMRLQHRHPGPADHVWACGNPGCSFEARNYDAHHHDAVHLLTERMVRLEAHTAWLLVQIEELFARIEAVDVRAEMARTMRGEVQA